jgi:hypothetical protein
VDLGITNVSVAGSCAPNGQVETSIKYRSRIHNPLLEEEANAGE